jgi:hypothetical protein
MTPPKKQVAVIATPKFPHHRDCEALTGITVDHLPRDGSLGRVRRYAKGEHREGPLHVDVQALTACLGSIMRGVD